MRIDSLDHLVLTVEDIDATIGFHTKALGMEIVTFGGGRKALSFGSRKINLQPARQRVLTQGAAADARI